MGSERVEPVRQDPSGRQLDGKQQAEDEMAEVGQQRAAVPSGYTAGETTHAPGSTDGFFDDGTFKLFLEHWHRQGRYIEFEVREDGKLYKDDRPL